MCVVCTRARVRTISSDSSYLLGQRAWVVPCMGCVFGLCVCASVLVHAHAHAHTHTQVCMREHKLVCACARACAVVCAPPARATLLFALCKLLRGQAMKACKKSHPYNQQRQRIPAGYRCRRRGRRTTPRLRRRDRKSATSGDRSHTAMTTWAPSSQSRRRQQQPQDPLESPAARREVAQARRPTDRRLSAGHAGNARPTSASASVCERARARVTG